MNIEFNDLSELNNIAKVNNIPGSNLVSSIDFNGNTIASWSAYPIKRFEVEADEVNSCWKFNGISSNEYTFSLSYDTIYWFDISNVSSFRNFTLLDPSGGTLPYFIEFIPNKVKIFGINIGIHPLHNYVLIKDANSNTFGGINDNCPHFVFNGYRKINSNRLLRRNDRILTNGNIDLTVGEGINGDQISIIPISGTPNISTIGNITFTGGSTTGTIDHSTILFYVDNSWFLRQ